MSNSLKQRKSWNILALVLCVIGIGFCGVGGYTWVTGIGVPSNVGSFDPEAFDPNDDPSEPIYIKSQEEAAGEDATDASSENTDPAASEEETTDDSASEDVVDMTPVPTESPNTPVSNELETTPVAEEEVTDNE